MKKILIIVGVFLLSLSVLLFIVVKGRNLSKNVEKSSKISTKSVKIRVKDDKENNVKQEEDKITTPSVPENTQNNGWETQKQVQNDTNTTSNFTQTTPSSPVENQNVIQNNTQQNVVQEEQPQIDPNTTDTSHPLYSVHHGVIEYGDYSSCTNAGYNIQRQHQNMNLSHSCVEVYSISGNVKGYYLDITNEGRDANYLK